MKRAILVSLAAASLTTMGCTVGAAGGTLGEHGQATFSYVFCLFDCGMDQAMMHGTEESIAVHAAQIPDVTVSSTAPQSVLVTNPLPIRQCCSSTSGSSTCRTITGGATCNANEKASISIAVVAVGPGSAELVLKQADSTVFDQIAVTVAEPASLAFSPQKDMSLGTDYGVSWTARDGSGAELMATTGVHLETSNASIVDFKANLLSSETSSVDASQIPVLGTSMVPRAAGDATITATAQSITTSFPVHVK